MALPNNNLNKENLENLENLIKKKLAKRNNQKLTNINHKDIWTIK